MSGSILFDSTDYRAAADANRDEAMVFDWPVAGAGDATNSFLGKAGLSDGLIAYAPHPGEPRSIFVIGMERFRSRPGRLRELVDVADRYWADCAERATRIIELRDATPEYAERSLVVLGDWSPLSGFCQAVARREDAADGRLRILLLRRQAAGPLRPAEMDWVHSAMPLFVESILAFCARKRAEQRASMVHALFDQMTVATMVVDPGARPLTINRAARQLLSRREGLRQTADGAVAACNPRDDRALRTAILDAVGAQEGDAGAMQAVRLTDKDGQWRLAVVMPARFCTAQNGSRAAIIVIHKPKVEAAPPCILSALGLLPSEQRFLDAFLNSNSLGETAERANLSPETARTYLKRVRAKLGAHRQMDLARLVHGLVPPMTPTASDQE